MHARFSCIYALDVPADREARGNNLFPFALQVDREVEAVVHAADRMSSTEGDDFPLQNADMNRFMQACLDS